MKKGWKYLNFEDCLEKVVFTTKILSKDYLSDGEFPIVSQEEGLISGYWNKREDLFRLKKPVVLFGDHTRVLKYVDFDFVIGADGVKILQPIEQLFAKFLYYFLQWYKVPSLGYSRHYKLLKEITVPIPPVDEQKEICSLLDKLNLLIEKKKEQVAELDNLAQSLFYEMFGDPITNERGWVIMELNEVCDVRDGTHDSPKYIDGGEYILITSKNIVDGRIDYTNINYISKEDYDAINKRSKVDDGDIIMAMIGTIGKPIIVKKEEYKFCIKNVALIKFYEDSRVNNVFIQALLNSTSFSRYIVSKNQGGTQKFVALGTIRKLPVPVPPLPLQQAFAEKVKAIELQKKIINMSIKDVQALLDAKMDYYFGE